MYAHSVQGLQGVLGQKSAVSEQFLKKWLSHKNKIKKNPLTHVFGRAGASSGEFTMFGPMKNSNPDARTPIIQNIFTLSLNIEVIYTLSRLTVSRVS